MLTVDVYHPVIYDWKLLPRSIRIIVTGIMFTLHPQIVYNAYNIFTITQISPTEPLHFYVANFRRITTCCLIPHQSVIAIKTISQLIIPFNNDLWMDETYISCEAFGIRSPPYRLQTYMLTTTCPRSTLSVFASSDTSKLIPRPRIRKLFHNTTHVAFGCNHIPIYACARYPYQRIYFDIEPRSDVTIIPTNVHFVFNMHAELRHNNYDYERIVLR